MLSPIGRVETGQIGGRILDGHAPTGAGRYIASNLLGLQLQFCIQAPGKGRLKSRIKQESREQEQDCEDRGIPVHQLLPNAQREYVPHSLHCSGSFN
jgi:hypothetical protein